MAARYQAGASGLPFAVMRGYLGSDLPKHNQNIRNVTCPFTDEVLAASPALRPDVTIIHAQKSDRNGNVVVEGIIGVQKEAALAARKVVVTVEEVVPAFNVGHNACILPSWVLTHICVVPRGAFPSYAQGYYQRDNAFCKAWDEISRDRDKFQAWMKTHVLSTSSFEEFLASLTRPDEGNLAHA